ncbi:MAG: LytTR family DNA-binding domain-containing protein [Bacteroidota bacterium]
MTSIIIDDEPLAAQLLAAYAEKAPELTVLGVFTNPIEALHFLGEHEVDLLFLDIQMPELTGIQLMKITRGKYHIILTTAYEQYALESYDFDVVDYLLKPISLDRFLLAVEKVHQRLTPAPASPTQGSTHTQDYLFIKSGHKTVRVNFADIIRLESMSNYVLVHTTTDKVMTLENMSQLVEWLPVSDFMRVHRSHVVALAKIDFVERNRIVIGSTYIPISDSYKDAFWDRIGR